MVYNYISFLFVSVCSVPNVDPLLRTIKIEAFIDAVAAVSLIMTMLTYNQNLSIWNFFLIQLIPFALTENTGNRKAIKISERISKISTFF